MYVVMWITGLETTFGHRTKTGQFTPKPNTKAFVWTLYPDKNYSRALFNMASRILYYYIQYRMSVKQVTDKMKK